MVRSTLGNLRYQAELIFKDCIAVDKRNQAFSAIQSRQYDLLVRLSEHFALLALNRLAPYMPPELFWRSYRQAFDYQHGLINHQVRSLAPFTPEMWTRVVKVAPKRMIDYFMTPEEALLFSQFPELIEVYRGVPRRGDPDGVSWSISPFVAAHYAKSTGQLQRAIVPKAAFIGFTQNEYSLVLPFCGALKHAHGVKKSIVSSRSYSPSAMAKRSLSVQLERMAEKRGEAYAS